MKTKPVIPRLVAEHDLDQVCDYYFTNGGPDVADAFLHAFEEITKFISQFPAGGSPRYGIESNLADVRFWPMKKFPYLIFYTETERYIDVWRVLHESRNIPSLMLDDE